METGWKEATLGINNYVKWCRFGRYNRTLSRESPESNFSSVPGMELGKDADQMYTWNKDEQDNEQAWQNQNTEGFGGLNTRQKQAEL